MRLDVTLAILTLALPAAARAQAVPGSVSHVRPDGGDDPHAHPSHVTLPVLAE